jgi:hypothetical protein
MKSFSGYCGISIAIVVLVAVSVLFSGCILPVSRQTPPATSTTEENAIPVTPAPVNTVVNASLPYGVTISVPADWTREDVFTSDVRDYGTETINIANFYSPQTIPDNPESYVSLSVDVDRNPVGDFEKYFNNATLAIGQIYGLPSQIEAHSYTIMISGYKSYELDFQSAAVKGTYIFVSTENGMYIFSFRTLNKPPAVQEFRGAVVDIYKSIRINPPSVDITPHR